MSILTKVRAVTGVVQVRIFTLVAVPLVLPICFMVFVLPGRHAQALLEAAEVKAQAMSTVLAVNASAPMNFKDTPSLNGLLATSETDPDIVYVRLMQTDRKPLALSGDVELALPLSGSDKLEMLERSSLLHVTAPITQDGVSLGWLQAGFSTQRIVDGSRDFRSMALALSAGVLVVAALMAMVLGRSFSKLFSQLRASIMETARRVDDVVNLLASVTAEQTSAASEESSALHESNATAADVGQAAAAAAQRASGLIEQGAKAEEGASAGVEAVSSSTQAMRAVRDQVKTLGSTMGALSERAAQIGEIASTVALLSERSNLLALNAAIEAARAGAQGRGFSVVAQEMRSLADGSNRSAAQVKAIITEIQAAIARAVTDASESERRVELAEQLSDRAGGTMRSFADSIRAFALVGKEIAASATQQSVAIEQMVESISHATQAGNTQLETTRQVEETTRQLRQLSRTMLETVGGAQGAAAPTAEV